jgi:3-deoxy-D-manno-octulosonic-acid transferase
MCNVDKIVEMVKTGQSSTPAMYLTLVKQTPEDFAKMRDELEERKISFTTRKRETEGKIQYDLYLVTGDDDSMALVASNSSAEWLEQRGFSLV